MRYEVAKCDRCGKSTEMLDRLSVDTGRHYDGVETNTVGHSLDLCHHCALTLLQRHIDLFSHEENKVWLKDNFPELK